MLEKQSSIQVNQTKNQLIKTVPSRDAAIVERIALQVFYDLQRPSPLFFLVPVLSKERSSERSTSMKFVRGFKVNDLIGILNRIIEYHPNRDLVQKAYGIKAGLLSINLENLAFFQHSETQCALQNALGAHTVSYNYRGKFIEALNYVLTICKYIPPSLTEILNDINHVCDVLENLPQSYFRDSVLKNQILLNEEFTEREMAEISYQISGYVHQSLYEPRRASYPLGKFYNYLLDLDPSCLQVYNIDFEQVAERVAVVDDWNQILTAEVVGINYNEGAEYTSKRLNLDPEAYHFSVVFRSFRAWARRLFYRFEQPEKWSERYSQETMAYHYFLVLNAVEILSNNTSKAPFLKNLLAMLNYCKPPSKPWSWIIHPITDVLQ
jgi:hypothetical protein